MNLCELWSFALFLHARNRPEGITGDYYMALCHEDWELPNSRIWLAEIDIDRSLDFPIKTGI